MNIMNGDLTMKRKVKTRRWMIVPKVLIHLQVYYIKVLLLNGAISPDCQWAIWMNLWAIKTLMLKCICGHKSQLAWTYDGCLRPEQVASWSPTSAIHFKHK